jgi:hypothetical protein
VPQSDEHAVPKRVKRRPQKTSVTNVNIFALSPGGEREGTVEPVVSAPALRPASTPTPEPDETFVSSQWLEKRSKRIDTLEQELRDRAIELERREAELEQREAEFEAEHFIRSEALEERERRLGELEDRLGRRESELGSYVARLQGGFLRADAL